MGEINSYQDLIAWQKAFRLGLRVHRAAGALPEHERFGLISQLRRSAIFAPSYIADGYGRGDGKGGPEYVRLLRNARGVIYEMDTQLLFSRELEYLPAEKYEPLKGELDEAERVLAGLIRSLGG